MPDWDAAIAHVHVPTLLLSAADDATTPIVSTRELLEALPATDKRLHVLARGGHFAPFDTPLREGAEAEREPPSPQPDEVRGAAAAVAGFLEEVL